MPVRCFQQEKAAAWYQQRNRDRMLLIALDFALVYGEEQPCSCAKDRSE